ncbi:spondin domain-containing protein [Oscillatoria sp. CS-180]|uniref:spondin domain-containing protein n=1 Tax=Oscillatoria sp. CS-180 TaxID=3021720 RepID=UPI00232BB3EC|nr:spondin domain-containing protein [Oscillatoria sp. CS-180]MDB9526475.1 spondin domain-containing protein [Oscillatoria sp. CS-180]
MQTQLTITVENLAPENGTSLTPFWFGIHDGGFDTYDRGRPASAGLESVAEDGATVEISREFDLSGFGTIQGTIGDAPIGPGESIEFEVTVDTDDPTSRYFNYASMILPSNDFFIANGNELAHEIFDEDGNFLGADFVVSGTAVLDAGTEVNDELPESTAFFGQSAPDTGTTENGVIQSAEGFIEDGRILSEPRFAAADFTQPDYEVVRITVAESEPDPLEPLAELIDLTGFDGEVSISLTLSREAAFDNILQFYETDAEGTIAGLKPGDTGYEDAVRENLIDGLELTVQNFETVDQDLLITGGTFYAPALLIDGDINNLATIDDAVTGMSRIERDGNIWGFEDLSDFDLNDFVLTLNSAEVA